MEKSKFFVSCLIFLFLSNCFLTAQPNSYPGDPKQFDVWARGMLQNLKPGETPQMVGNIIIERLKNFRFTSDSIILTSIDYYFKYDKYLVFKTKATIYDDSLFITVPYIDSLQNLMYGRENLLFSIQLKKLHVIKNSMCHVCNKIEEYKKVLPALDSMRTRMQILRLEILNSIATYTEYENKDIEEAEELYRQVLDYPFFRVKGEDFSSMAFKQYITAGKGIIRCRKDNLKMLERTSFIPAAAKILDPIRDEAIEKLKK